jgi:D-3-phosphoglycerate dehydrogenase
MIVTPHLGASTFEAQENVAIDVSEQVINILRNEPFKNAVNMPPVPANVLNKLQPYFVLGQSLGYFAAQIAEGPIAEINIHYSGDLADVDTAPLTRHVLKGILSYHLGQDEVNEVNVMHIAKQRELTVNINKSSASKGFTNLVSVSVKTNQEERSVSGTLLNGYGARIVKIDQFPIDIAPEGNFIMISHNDRPGIIGKVGTLLGQNDVNIATMQVGRKGVGGAAVMILAIDKAAPKEVVDQLNTFPELMKAKEITL